MIFYLLRYQVWRLLSVQEQTINLTIQYLFPPSSELLVWDSPLAVCGTSNNIKCIELQFYRDPNRFNQF